MTVRESEQLNRGWLARLLRHCWRHRRSVLLAVGASVVGMAALASIPLAQRAIIDGVVLGNGELATPAAVLLTAAAVAYGATFVRRYFASRVSLDVQYDLRTDLFAALSRLDGARQDQLSTGQIVGRSISDITMLQALLQMGPIMIGNVLLFAMALGIMSVLSPLLTAVALAVGPGLWWRGCLGAGCSRPHGTPSSRTAWLPGWWTTRSPVSGWSRGLARRPRSCPS